MNADSSRLREALDRGLQPGGDLDAELDLLGDYEVTTRPDAQALADAVARLSGPDVEARASGLHLLVGLFQSVGTREAFEVLRAEGVPRLLQAYDAALGSENVRPNDLLFLLKVASMYRSEEAVERVVTAVRRRFDPESYLWSVVFSVHDDDHPYRLRLFQALRDPLPDGFVGVVYLDLANDVLRDGHVSSHPFDTPEGRERLRSYLTNAEPSSYARSAAAALAYVQRPERDALFALAMDHPESEVQLEAARSSARLGSEAALKFLARSCLDPRTARSAVATLNELGQSSWIPGEALEPDFQARAEMSAWLAHPNEFGRVPDAVEVLDTRVLAWPPTNDRRRLWLVSYRYAPSAPGEPSSEGVGLVGSITFALFGEATAELSPDDLYALYCCWELQVRGDPRAPEDRSTETGRTLLNEAERDLS